MSDKKPDGPVLLSGGNPQIAKGEGGRAGSSLYRRDAGMEK